MWDYIDEVEINSDVNQIHVGTRDFHCLLREEHLDLRDAKHPEITRVLHKKEYLIHESKIKEFIKSLETVTGGKGTWRMMNFDKISTLPGWFKYVRLYRVKDDYFVVCNRDNIPVNYSLMNSDNLAEDVNFIKE